MNNNSLELSQLRNNLDFASTAQFFHTFQSAFHPWPTVSSEVNVGRHTDSFEYAFETEDLERLILEVSERSRFEELVVKMLRFISHNRFINTSNWQTYFSKEFDKREYGNNPFVSTLDQDQTEPTLINYFTMTLDTRVHLLHLLCEWQLDEPDKFREHLDSEEDAVQWRVDPIGFDKKGATFWLFDDNRLYKETPKPTPVKKTNNKRKRRTFAPARKSSRRSNRTTTHREEEEESEEEEEWVPWKLVCLTKNDWEQFPAKYKDSDNTDEQRFYKLLVDDLLPKVLPVLEEHEKEIIKQQAMMHRKRSSRIMIRELEALSVDPSMMADPYGHGGRTSSRLEKRIIEKQIHEKEQLAKAREERLLERERRIMEREYRALEREKRQESQPPPEPVEPVVKKKEEEKKPPQEEVKPKRKYTKRPKFDEFGNPIPRKVKLDKDGNPIPLKKRGRKPKNRNLEEENWVFDCICGVSGQNVDDGTPMIACEKCGIWQHIGCLQKSGIVEKDKSLDNLVFICQRCDCGELETTEAMKPSIQLPSLQPSSSPLDVRGSSELNSLQAILSQSPPSIPQSSIRSGFEGPQPSSIRSEPILANGAQQSAIRNDIISQDSSVRHDPVLTNGPQQSSIRTEPTLPNGPQQSSIRTESTITSINENSNLDNK